MTRRRMPTLGERQAEMNPVLLALRNAEVIDRAQWEATVAVLGAQIDAQHMYWHDRQRFMERLREGQLRVAASGEAGRAVLRVAQSQAEDEGVHLPGLRMVAFVSEQAAAVGAAHEP